MVNLRRSLQNGIDPDSRQRVKDLSCGPAKGWVHSMPLGRSALT